jgi:hypothetical protein
MMSRIHPAAGENEAVEAVQARPPASALDGLPKADLRRQTSAYMENQRNVERIETERAERRKQGCQNCRRGVFCCPRNGD